MCECSNCGEWYHLKCLDLGPAERKSARAAASNQTNVSTWVCPGCMMPDGTPNQGRLHSACFSLSEVFEGMGIATYALCILVSEGRVRPFRKLWACEWDESAQQLSIELGKKLPLQLALCQFRDFKKLFSAATPAATDLGVVSFPCCRFSRQVSASRTAKDLRDGETMSLMMQLLKCVRQQLWQVILVENVMPFYSSDAWEEFMTCAGQHGYSLHKVLVINSMDVAQPQSRERGFAVLSLASVATAGIDIQCLFEQQKRIHLDSLTSQGARRTLEEYILSDTEHAGLGLTADLMAQFSIHQLEAIKLSAYLQTKGISMDQAAQEWYVIDLNNSPDWLNINRHGCAPTLTAAHSMRSLFVTHHSVNRFLTPFEHLLLMGCDMCQLHAAADALLRVPSHGKRVRGLRAIGKIAGNAICVSVAKVVLQTLSCFFPNIFLHQQSPQANTLL